MPSTNTPSDREAVGFLPTGVEESAVRSYLQKLLGSEPFSKSEKLKDFLRFVIEKGLSGESSNLKEYTLGVEIFQRDGGFDPRTNPIVRVHAGRLRSKLREYYESDGKDDAIVISLPKHGYVPHISLRGSAESTPGSSRQSVGHTADTNSIAVLPFVNLSRDDETEILADGLAEDLTLQLSKVPRLAVISRTSSMRYKNSGKTLKEAAEELAADCIVEGSVRRSGDRVRIVVRLIQAQTDLHLWGKTYERETTDVMEVEGDLALRIATSLSKRISAKKRESIRRTGTKSHPAFERYLKARSLLRKQERTQTEEAIRLFAEAAEEDPKFAAAYAGLADAYCSLVYGHHLPASKGLAIAAEAINRAVAIDATEVEALTSRAFVRALSFEPEAAEKAFRRALLAGPGYAPAYFGLGVFLGLRGRFDEGLAELRRSQSLDPFSALVFLHLAAHYLWRREFDTALREARRAIELAPGWPPACALVSLALVHEHRYPEALSALDALGDPGEAYPLAAIIRGYSYAVAGRARKAREILEGFRETEKREHDPYVLGRAAIHVALGENDAALRALENAWTRRDPGLLFLRVGPVWDPLRGDPLFQSLLDRLKLGPISLPRLAIKK